MGLPTGVELKTAEPVKTEVATAIVEEVKPCITPIAMDTAATGADSVEATDGAEVWVLGVELKTMFLDTRLGFDSSLLYCSCLQRN